MNGQLRSVFIKDKEAVKVNETRTDFQIYINLYISRLIIQLSHN